MNLLSSPFNPLENNISFGPVSDRSIVKQLAFTGNLLSLCGPFTKTREFIDKGDAEAAIQSLKEIAGMPGLQKQQYLHAYYFLHEILAFSKDYFELYGVSYTTRN